MSKLNLDPSSKLKLDASSYLLLDATGEGATGKMIVYAVKRRHPKPM